MIPRFSWVSSRALALADSARRLSLPFLLLGLLSASCATSPGAPLGPDGQPDAVLQQGLDIYGAQCAQCHGRQGQGGRGKKLDAGRSLERYPQATDMADVVTNGLNAGMPSFADKLDPTEVNAVVRYVREVLN